MDNETSDEALIRGARGLGVALEAGAATLLGRFTGELLRWNQKVNLTAITRPDEVLEKHLLDSLALVPEVTAARSLLDLGAGAGFPGLPLAVALPRLEVTLVDAAAKKVGFLKHVVAQLGLAPRVRAVHARAEGRPDQEGLSRSEVVVSRALAEPARWLALAAEYLAPGGRALVMTARPLGPDESARLAAATGLKLAAERSYTLPFSRAPRAVAVFQRPK